MEFPSIGEFWSWLAAKPLDESVGRVCDMGECPLAVYLKAHGAEHPYVRPDNFADKSFWRPCNDPKQGSALPEWANAFANRIDQLAVNAVTAKMALTALR